MVPELISKDDMVYPHEHQRYISNEPHFQRVWQHYREHVFRLKFAFLVEQGTISKEDAVAFKNFIDLANAPTFTLYIYGRLGQLPHLENEPGYQATLRVMEKIGLHRIEIDKKTAQPYEEQFWDQYDIYMELNEEDMVKELPAFIIDPSNKAKVEALLSGRQNAAIEPEATHKIAAAL